MRFCEARALRKAQHCAYRLPADTKGRLLASGGVLPISASRHRQLCGLGLATSQALGLGWSDGVNPVRGTTTAPGDWNVDALD